MPEFAVESIGGGQRDACMRSGWQAAMTPSAVVDPIWEREVLGDAQRRFSGRQGVATMNVAVKVEDDSAARCYTYVDRGPILAVRTPAMHLSVCGWSDQPVSLGELEFARSLLAAAQVYLVEVESRIDHHQNAGRDRDNGASGRSGGLLRK